MAQSLFRLLLGQSPYRLRHAASSAYGASRADRSAVRGCSVRIRCWREPPQRSCLRCGHSPPKCRWCPGRSVFDVDAPPATYQILEGEIRLESPDQAPILVSPGATFGVADTLAGTPSGWQSRRDRHGRALRLDRDDLFAVMADHVDLMQNLFTEALRLRDHGRPAQHSTGTAVFRVESGSSVQEGAFHGSSSHADDRRRSHSGCRRAGIRRPGHGRHPVRVSHRARWRPSC